MKIQYLNGGLANQVFQYIFYRYGQLSTEHPEEWFLDDSFFFFKKEHNGYELEKIFGIKPNLLSKQFSPEAWNFFVENRKNNIGAAQTMANMGFPVQMITEADNYKTANPFHGIVHKIDCNEFNPQIVHFSNPVIYYHGYWINKHWLERYKTQLLEELSFPPITDEKNLIYASRIKSTLSVGIHLRRGDFIKYGWELDPELYYAYCKDVIDIYPDASFFVFSDDIPWCKENIEQLGLSLSKDIIFVEGNTAGTNYIDMQLMTMCKGLVVSNSSFSYLAALMNQNLEFFINSTPYREI